MTTIKKFDWGKRKKKNLKSLIGFLSDNNINNYNRGGKKKKKEKKKKESTEQVKKQE